MIKISVVIPTFKRPDLLARCIGALRRQNLDPGEFEIIVADNAGDKRTLSLIRHSSSNGGPVVRYIPAADKPGPAAARNAGCREACGDIIAFTDDDCVPDPDWLCEGLRVFDADLETSAAAGRVVMPLPAEPTDYELNESGLARAEFVTANCFIRRSCLAEMGGFDERFTAAWREDSDLHFRLLKSGLKITRAERAVVVHPIRPGRFGVSVFQQRKSMFDALLYRKHPVLFDEKISFSPLPFYAATTLLIAGTAGIATGHRNASAVAFAAWGLLAGRFCLKRLTNTRRSPVHVAEMILTSALIPTVAVFWRLCGAVKFRVPFL